jgi:hypothetical protein
VDEEAVNGIFKTVNRRAHDYLIPRPVPILPGVRSLMAVQEFKVEKFIAEIFNSGAGPELTRRRAQFKPFGEANCNFEIAKWWGGC